MEAVAYLDTHVVAWLYAGNTSAFPAGVRNLIATSTLLISPMVGLELAYLHEIGRVAEGPATVLPALHATIGLTVCNRPFAEIARCAWGQDWTRDPFDRMITSQAAVGSDVLISKDATIAANYPHTKW